jgi:putative membrane protein
MDKTVAHPSDEKFDPTTISRPDRSLLKYYLLVALLTLPAFPFVFLPLLFKYETLKYKFDDEGVSMSWGMLFRREIHLAYRRIQDIHLTRNLLQRWMGLATVAIQTASGSAGPEMSIEGILQAGPLRDYLYAQMRGARGETEPGDSVAESGDGSLASGGGDEALGLLHEIRDALRHLASQKEAR